MGPTGFAITFLGGSYYLLWAILDLLSQLIIQEEKQVQKRIEEIDVKQREVYCC